MIDDGKRFNDDSSGSEKTLMIAIDEIMPYIKEKCENIGGILDYKKSISLYECQEYFHKVGGSAPNPENKKVCMKPDGGIFYLILNEIRYPLLIIEDKVQGTNDILFQQKKKRQATGNAIERAAKNIRGAEMLFSEMNIFPYVIFASGCDFHSSETIAKRIEMMNMGFPNHYIEITPTETKPDLSSIIENININKIVNKSIASVFIKSHKWDEMKHGSSLWKKDEIVIIIKTIIDKIFISIRN
jgi:hypothetical protein